MQNNKKRMKIGLFSPVPFSLKLGATKNRVELAEALTELGWECDIVGLSALGIDNTKAVDKQAYNTALKNYLIKNGHLYNVVLYEYYSLPFERSLFPATTLFIARPALLHYNYESVRIPMPLFLRIKDVLSRIVSLKKRDITLTKKQLFQFAETTLKNSDMIQVQSEKDKELLVSKNFDPYKIIVVPNGILPMRIEKFRYYYSRRVYTTNMTIAFVGTFDYRKGAQDFPYIISKLLKMAPSTKFILLGTKGLFTKEKDILHFFPKWTRKNIQVIMQFEPDDLPELLSHCHIGIFPSYHESFGYGALEMMASGLPVISYNVPGPSDFALPSLLVDIGDRKLMVNKVFSLINDPDKLYTYSLLVKKIALEYDWRKISKYVDSEYTKRVNALKENSL